jgi:polyisoprenoid-binding protein YceI
MPTASLVSRLTQLLLASAAFVALTAASARAAVETYEIDPSHSSVGFSIRHFVSKVPGRFTKFAGSITVDRDNLEKSSVNARIEIASVDTAEPDRDTHLKSPDFFDAAKHPAMTFASTAWKKTGTDTFDVTGDLTIKGIKKPVVLKVTLLGFGPGMGGAQLSGWEGTTTIKKSDFDLKGPAMLGAVLGDDVTITIAVEAGLKK